MDEAWLQILDYAGQGFQPLVYFGGWRVAILRAPEDAGAQGVDTMERHTQTDEVFVLTRGRGILLIGGKGARAEGVFPQSMEAGRIYNVRCNVWHAILLSQDASVLIVENGDTSPSNSQYVELGPEELDLVRGIEKREALD